MALPFTPRFVDLVRTFTTTEGTGPIVPGAAVQGFSNFADKLSVGDQFYYCVQGISKAEEREVGRGTLQADGSILRDPVDGSPTDFSPGAKTVALVAAAEWFDKLESAALGGGGAGGEMVSVATRGALARADVVGTAARLLCERGREGVFTFDPADRHALVAADTLQAICIAPASDPTGRSGAWIRQFSGHADARWWGFVADDNGTSGTDNSPAMAAALRTLAALGTSDLPSAGRLFTPALRIPTGFYYFSQSIDLKQSLRLSGDGGRDSKNVRLRFPRDTDGIIVNRADTLGNGTVQPSTTMADGSIIEGITLLGGGGTRGSGFRLRARAHVRDCVAENFGLDGCHIFAWTGGGATPENRGNANCFFLSHCVFTSNGRHGVYAAGSDANAGVGIALDCSHNACGGIMDMSFLGNSWIGCHAEQNGNRNYAGSGPLPCVNHDGACYDVVLGKEELAASTPPGTDDQVWHRRGNYPLAHAPAWVQGISVRGGAPYGANDPNNRSRWYGCYAEGGQGPVQMYAKAMFDGFVDEVGFLGFGRTLVGDGNRRFFQSGIETLGDVVANGSVRLSGDSRGYGGSSGWLYRNSYTGLCLMGDGSGHDITLGNKAGATVMCVPAGSQKALFWGDVEVAGTLIAKGLLSNGEKGDIIVSGAGSSLTVNAATPPGGDFRLSGRLVIASNQGFGGLGGNVGIYKSASDGLAMVAATGSANDISLYTPQGAAVFKVPTGTQSTLFFGKTGYADGSGGSVTQATAKSAAVTLNRTCGQIILHGAPLDAGASVSFVLNNALIGMNDEVSVWIKSGASPDAYGVSVTGVSEGSCRVQLRNFSAGSLGEVLTLGFAVRRGATN